MISCSDILDENPKSIATETFYNTPQEVAAAANAMYAPLKQNGFINYLMILECCSDYAYGRGSYAFLNDFGGLNPTFIGKIGSLWAPLYLSIRNANLVIKSTPNGSGTTEDEKSQFIAEAKFIRALDYFILVKSWAGVPIRTEDNMDEIDLARSSANDVYKLILDDLSFAEQYLPDEPRLVGSPSKWTAKTVLADVYLNLEEWGNARDKAQEVISSGKYALVEVSEPDNFEKIYGADVITTTEEVFYLKYSDEEGWYGLNYFHTSSSGYKPYGSNWYAIYSKSDNLFYTSWNDNDLRKQHNFYSWNIGLGTNTLLFKKYIDPTGTTAASNDYPLYRYPELLLIYAEAANKANGGPTSEALECVNQIHRRAYGYNPNMSSAVDFKIGDYDEMSFDELVIQEKGYETLLEGKRWLDLVRTGRASETIKSVLGIDLNESLYLWPIPEVETNYNKAIDPVADQNPGY